MEFLLILPKADRRLSTGTLQKFHRIHAQVSYGWIWGDTFQIFASILIYWHILISNIRLRILELLKIGDRKAFIKFMFI